MPALCYVQAFNVWGDREEALDLRVHFPNLKMVLWFDEVMVHSCLPCSWYKAGSHQLCRTSCQDSRDYVTPTPWPCSCSLSDT